MAVGGSAARLTNQQSTSTGIGNKIDSRLLYNTQPPNRISIGNRRFAMAHSVAIEYYNRIKSKWATEYPSSEEIEEIWSFYRECGYKDPPATLRSMVDPITFTRRRILDYGCDKALMLDFFCNSIKMKVSTYPYLLDQFIFLLYSTP